jgi:hypothetical protein
MPTSTVIVVVGVLVAFTLFSAVLAWVNHTTGAPESRKARSGQKVSSS